MTELLDDCGDDGGEEDSQRHMEQAINSSLRELCKHDVVVLFKTNGVRQHCQRVRPPATRLVSGTCMCSRMRTSMETCFRDVRICRQNVVFEHCHENTKANHAQRTQDLLVFTNDLRCLTDAIWARAWVLHDIRKCSHLSYYSSL